MLLCSRQLVRANCSDGELFLFEAAPAARDSTRRTGLKFAGLACTRNNAEPEGRRLDAAAVLMLCRDVVSDGRTGRQRRVAWQPSRGKPWLPLAWPLRRARDRRGTSAQVVARLSAGKRKYAAAAAVAASANRKLGNSLLSSLHFAPPPPPPLPQLATAITLTDAAAAAIGQVSQAT